VPVAYVYSDKDFVQFGFLRGSVLKDSKKLLEGSGAHVRHVKVRAVGAIDKAAFGALLREAIAVTPESFSDLKKATSGSRPKARKAAARKAPAKSAKKKAVRKAKR
jgi:hypothetical protein